ncbi:MAG: hypothetical protein JO072_12515 [Parafilimonas sp.]|nr:hypothetical protein [Parafilimonas sp.]
MKKFHFITLITMFCGIHVFAQNAFQTQNVYTGYAVNGGDVVLPTYKANSEVEGNPYFSKDWVKGSVQTNDNQQFSKKLLFMYDKVAGTLYFKNADSTTIMEADQTKIYSFILITDKPHTFMRGDIFSKDYAGKFVEALVYDDKKYSLVKYTITSFQEPETSKASQAMTQSISYGKYVDKVTYFLAYDNSLHPVELKKKSFPKAFKPNDVSKAEDYVKNTGGNFNEAYAILMLDSINSSIQ